MKKYLYITLGLLAVPALTFAQTASERATAEAASFVGRFNAVILYPTLGLLSAVALLVFLFGCFQYVVYAGNDQARAQGVKHITWGIVGLVVMLSAYTILLIVTATFGLDDELDCARNPSGTGCEGGPIPIETFPDVIESGDRDVIETGERNVIET